ncbi:MAG: DNA repair protein RadC [Gemmatimonadota bacterium]
MTTEVPIPDSERPRERLRRVGSDGLSLVELLTLCIGSGSQGRSGREIAEAVGARPGGLARLARTDVAELERVSGVGPATAARLVAAIELGRRCAATVADPGAPVRGPADVFDRMHPRLRDASQEEFHTVLLNTRHQVIREVLVTRGILDASLIHPREVFRTAVVEGAAALVLVHNHPSGDPTPSHEDRVVTRQLAEAGRALGIPVVDHLVIGRARYVSLASEIGP